MKRRDLIRRLEAHGCVLLREGGNHSVHVNRPSGKVSTVPRHRGINDFLARKIRRDLEVPDPQKAQPRVRADGRKRASLACGALLASLVGRRSTRALAFTEY